MTVPDRSTFESAYAGQPSRYEVRPDLKDISFSEGGPKAWFVVVARAR